MSRLGKFLIWFWIAVAIWFSERWASVLPALCGVVGGVVLARAQRTHRRRGAHGVPPFEIGSLLIIVSFTYLYALFLIFQVGGLGHSLVGLCVGFALLSLLLMGLVAVIFFKYRLPRWVSRIWETLLEER